MYDDILYFVTVFIRDRRECSGRLKSDEQRSDGRVY